MSSSNETNEAIDNTRDTSIDFVYSSEPDDVGLAVLCIWAYLIPHFYIEYAEYKIALTNSPTWGHQPERLQAAKRALTRSFFLHIFLGIVLYGGSSALINMLTWKMDRRASDIVTGNSHLFAGWMFMLLSVDLPQWMGVYVSVEDSYKNKIALFRTTREVQFSFSLSLWKHLATLFAFDLYFSCDTDEFTVLFGFLVAIPIGALFILGVWIVRVKLKKYKRILAALVAITLSIVSIFCVISGTAYIEDTWHEDYARGMYVYGPINYTALVCFLWLVFVFFVHMVAVYVTRKQRREGKVRFRYHSQVFQQTLPGIRKNSNKDTTVGIEEESSDNNSDREDNEKDHENAPHEEPEDGDDTTKDDPENVHGENGDDDDADVDFEIPELKTGATTKGFLIDNSEGNSFWYLLRLKLYETYGYCCCFCSCCCKDIKDDNNLNGTCTHAGDELKRKNPLWRFLDGFKIFLWYCISAFFLYLTIVNCGATQQQMIVRENLTSVIEMLYPDNYQTGPMCGWSEKNENGTIKSFGSLQELHDANYTLIHCGKCGKCSNWNDLSKLWTTRTNLVENTRKCAQKSVFGGSFEDVVQCNMDEPVGFTEGCAKCWAVDELCAKDNCFWIFLQSHSIDAVSDYRVQLNDVTSATCDEAICGPEFVSCSGATRRRMNIKSDIERPKYQQCTPQTEDWSVVFNSP